jgi:protein phosphatase PTC7
LNPHKDKRAKGGEDAASLADNMLAVADGVGGWAQHGVDPAIYSRKLCLNIEKLFTNQPQQYIYSPKNLLVKAVADNKETGSATCVIATLDQEQPMLYTCNLGDSGYLILRKSGTELSQIFKSKEQTHSFNFPK